MVADERLQLEDIKIAFTNDQNSGKSQIKIWFAEVEEKPTILTFVIPNPSMSRLELIDSLKRRVGEIVHKLDVFQKEQDVFN